MLYNNCDVHDLDVFYGQYCSSEINGIGLICVTIEAQDLTNILFYLLPEDGAQRSPYERPRANIFSQNGLEHVWLINVLMHDFIMEK